MAAKTTLEGARLLRKLIPGTSFLLDAEDNFSFSPGDEASGWFIVENDIGQTFAVWRGYFDLAGLSMQDLTMMVAVPSWQECDTWSLSQVAAGLVPLVRTWDILSKAHIPDTALDSDRWIDVTAGTFKGWRAPGMIGSEYNLEEIFSGRFRQFIINSTYSAGLALGQSAETAWGAGDATAGDKIYITRVVVLEATISYPGGLMVIPPMSVLIPIALLEEPDLVHMERLRRSYVEQDSRP